MRGSGELAGEVGSRKSEIVFELVFIKLMEPWGRLPGTLKNGTLPRSSDVLGLSSFIIYITYSIQYIHIRDIKLR